MKYGQEIWQILRNVRERGRALITRVIVGESQKRLKISLRNT